MNWFFLALSAGLVSALNVLFSKRMVAQKPATPSRLVPNTQTSTPQGLSPLLIGGMTHLLGGILCLLALPFATPKFSLDSKLFLALLGMGLVYTLGNSLYFLALSRTDLSEIDILLRTSSLWTFLLGVLLLAEPYGLNTLIASLFILSSLLLLSKQRFPIRFNKSQLLALAAATSFGLGNVIDKALSPAFDALTYTTLNLLLTGIFMLLVAKPNRLSLGTPSLWGLNSWAIAASFALTQMLIILAFAAGGSAGQVILVAQVRLVILMSVGIILLKERDKLAFKLLAAFFMIGGLLLLYY